MTSTTGRKVCFVIVLVLFLFGISSIARAQDDTPDCPRSLEGPLTDLATRVMETDMILRQLPRI